MTILGIFLNNEIRTGGHQRYLELMEGLAERGNDVRVLMNAALERETRVFTRLNVELLYKRGSRPFNGLKFLSATREAIQRYDTELGIKADCILIFGETHWGSAKLLSAHTGAPILFALRSDFIEENGIYLRTERINVIQRLRFHLRIWRERVRERDIARRASRIVFQSEFDRNNFIRRNPLSAGITRVIRGDIRQRRFKPELAFSNRSTRCKRILFVGNLGMRKGLRYLIEALEMAKSAGATDLSLDILAAGTDFSAFAAMIEERGLSDSVRFHGKVGDPLPFMRDADLLVAPSLFDSYPNTILEALHVGLPAIGSAVGGIPDMLGDETLLFAPANVEALADKIILLNRDPDTYAKARNICHRRRDYFDFDWAAEWEKVMSEIVSDGVIEKER